VRFLAALLLCAAACASGRTLSSRLQVSDAWQRFHRVYLARDAGPLCSLLSSTAQADLEQQVGVGSCNTAARAWFESVEFDRSAAIHARLVWVVHGAYAETYDSDPNSPASYWVRARGKWTLAYFFILG
jgi:hypothetical protein